MRTGVSVVVPNLNGADVLPACLDSLLAQTEAPDEIIVVDNGSTDGSAALLAARSPSVRVIALPANLGFAGGVNVGIRAATGTYVWLFNNDACAEPDCLAELLRTARAQDADITAPVILTDGGATIDSDGEVLSVWGLPFPRHRGFPVSRLPERDEEIFAASGAASLFRRSLFDEVGLFDEAFFAYFEDVDLSTRARLAGNRVFLSRRAVVQHLMNRTSASMPGLVQEMCIKNMFFLYWKNFPTRLLWRYAPRVFVGESRLVFSAVRRGHPGAALRAARKVLAHLPSLRRDRAEVQRLRVISDEAFDRMLVPVWVNRRAELDA